MLKYHCICHDPRVRIHPQCKAETHTSLTQREAAEDAATAQDEAELDHEADTASSVEEDHLEVLREKFNPDHVGQTEYRIIYDALEDMREAGEEHAITMLDEIMSWARAAKCAITGKIDHGNEENLKDWLLQSSFDGTICHDTVEKVWKAAHGEGPLVDRQGHEEDEEPEEDNE